MERDATTRPRLTKRVCRYCRGEYRAPVGTRPHACPRCAPTIEQELELAAKDAAAAAGTGHEGIPF